MQSIVRIILLAQLVFCQAIASAANFTIDTHEKTDSINVVIKGDSAYQWVGEHLDSLANS